MQVYVHHQQQHPHQASTFLGGNTLAYPQPQQQIFNLGAVQHATLVSHQT